MNPLVRQYQKQAQNSREIEPIVEVVLKLNLLHLNFLMELN